MHTDLTQLIAEAVHPPDTAAEVVHPPDFTVESPWKEYLEMVQYTTYSVSVFHRGAVRAGTCFGKSCRENRTHPNQTTQ